MKALVKPSMYTRLTWRGGEEGVKTFAKLNQQPAPNDNIPTRCKMCVTASHVKGDKSAKDSMDKVKSSCAKCQQSVCQMHTITSMSNQYVKCIQLRLL